MLCLTLTVPVEEIAWSAGRAATALADKQIVYASVSQPAQCAVNQYVLLTHGEIQNSNPFNLPMEAASPIAAAVLGVWAVAFGIRMAIRAVRDSGGDYAHDGD